MTHEGFLFLILSFKFILTDKLREMMSIVPGQRRPEQIAEVNVSKNGNSRLDIKSLLTPPLTLR